MKLSGIGSLLVAAAICFAPCAQSTVLVGGTPSFTATRAQIERSDCTVDLAVCAAVDTDLHSSFAEAGQPSSAYARGRSAFGDNGGYAVVTAAGVEYEAYAESIWGDRFVVLGGSGQSVLSISVRVEGLFAGPVKAGGPGANSYYLLYVSDSAMTCDFDDVACSGTLAMPPVEEISGVSYLGATIPFTYGTPFYLASYLGAEVIGGVSGVADFFHSAHFGITAPDGAILTTASGTQYASAVPEAGTWLMLLAGIALLYRRAVVSCCSALLFGATHGSSRALQLSRHALGGTGPTTSRRPRMPCDVDMRRSGQAVAYSDNLSFS